MEATTVPVIKRGSNVALGALRDVCLERERNHRDEIVSLKSLSMDAAQPGRIIVKRGEHAKAEDFGMDRHIYGQAPAVLYGLPGSYLRKLVEGDAPDFELAALNFNHWVKNNKDREVLLRLRNTDEGAIVRGMLPASWNKIPYDAVIDVLTAKYGPDQRVHIEQFNERELVLNFVTGKLSDRKGSQAGDDVEWGMRYSDSDVGLRPKLELLPYTLTLWCDNGATTMAKGASVGISHSSKQSETIEDVMANVRQGMEMITGYSQTIVAQMDKAAGISLAKDHLEETFKVIAKRFDVTKLQDRHVREAWNSETKRDPSVLRLVNSFTRAANSEELDTDSRFRLQAIGGAILELADNDSYRWN